jgi:cytochrome c peroxidase
MITMPVRPALVAAVLLLSLPSADAENLIVPVYGEPIQPIPIDTSLDPAKSALGEKLFHDSLLSTDNSLSCASCHHLDNGGDDGMPTGIALGGAKHVINTPTVFNARYNFRQNWDGSARNLADQIDMVLRSHMEANSNWDEVLDKLKNHAEYPAAFRAVYSDGITKQNVIDALVDYENSLTTPNARFDRYLLGDLTAVDRKELKGYELFKDYGCASCHQGVNIGGNLYQKFGIFYDYLAERGNITNADYGRINITNEKEDLYVFKVPSLRNVEVTAPYFHDGSAETLEEAVSIMGYTQLGKSIDRKDIDLLVSFLKTLTGEYNGKYLSEYPAE